MAEQHPVLVLLSKAQFMTSAPRLSACPPGIGHEVAFVGRSNAGKSSAINTIVGHTRLAYVSKTPGRTQLINVFRMRNGAALIDLPGYGYAKVPEEVRRDWVRLLEHYLSRRQNLVGLVLIMDSRHPLRELDWQMIEWFAPSGRPIHCLLTKSDKLTKQEQALTLREVTGQLAGYEGRVTVQLFSSLKKTGIDEVGKVVGAWLPAAADADPDADADDIGDDIGDD